MLEERTEAGTGEAMTRELGLGNPKLIFAQAVGMAQLQDVSEVLNMRGLVRAEHKDIININKTVR